MVITYNAGTNTITVTGYTEATPCTFLDLYNADVAGGWGVITRQCTVQYCLSCKIVIGDGSTATYFCDKLIQIVFVDGIASSHYEKLIEVKDNAYLTFGEIHNAGLKLSRYGVQIIDLEDTWLTFLIWNANTSNCQVRLYSSCISRGEAGHQKTAIHIKNFAPIYNCKFDKVILHTCDMDLYNHSNCRCEIMENPSGSSVLNEIFEYSADEGIVFAYDYSQTIKNVIIKNCVVAIRAVNYTLPSTINLVNADCEWSFYWVSATPLKVYRQYDFNLKVQDKDENAISGATVKIWDKNNNLVVDTTTNASGEIATQTLNYGYYTQAGGDTPVTQTPHIIQISKAGHQTYKKKFTVDEKINWQIRLLQANPVQFLNDDPILQLCPESQEGDRILFEVI